MKPDLFAADTLDRDNPPPLSDYGRRLLAEGDSWFTISTASLPSASNVLFNLEFTSTTAIINCAYPGDTLQHMVDSVNDPYFDRLLRQPRFARFWEAILISAGGNDLIDAAQAAPTQKDGTPAPREHRLLLTAAEVRASKSDAGKAANPAPGDFISEPGFTALSGYLLANFRELVRRRDLGPSAGRPLLLHTYATPTVRPAGTVGAPKGWLYPAFVAYGIPQPLWTGVVEILFDRLRRLLLALDEGSGQPEALKAVHVFDSASLPITPAQAGSTGPSGDWVNEIHLTADGYAKMGRAFGPMIEGVLARYG